MDDKELQLNPYFYQLVLSLQSAAMFQMGKTVSPISGKIERDLVQARGSIDLLIMLQDKTQGNLSQDEKQILDSAVYNLQMNFLDESKKDDDTSSIEKDESADLNDSEDSEEKAGENPESESSGEA